MHYLPATLLFTRTFHALTASRRWPQDFIHEYKQPIKTQYVFTSIPFSQWEWGQLSHAFFVSVQCDIPGFSFGIDCIGVLPCLCGFFLISIFQDKQHPVQLHADCWLKHYPCLHLENTTWLRSAASRCRPIDLWIDNWWWQDGKFSMVEFNKCIKGLACARLQSMWSHHKQNTFSVTISTSIERFL